MSKKQTGRTRATRTNATSADRPRLTQHRDVNPRDSEGFFLAMVSQAIAALWPKGGIPPLVAAMVLVFWNLAASAPQHALGLLPPIWLLTFLIFKQNGK